MSATKTITSLWSSYAIATTGGPFTSSLATLSTGYGALVCVNVVNNATSPTAGSNIQIQVSFDNSVWYNWGGALVAGTAASTTYSWSVCLDKAVKYVQLTATNTTGGTTEAVTSQICEVS